MNPIMQTGMEIKQIRRFNNYSDGIRWLQSRLKENGKGQLIPLLFIEILEELKNKVENADGGNLRSGKMPFR